MRFTLLAALFLACTPPEEDAASPTIDPATLVLPQSSSAVAANEDLPTVIVTKKTLMLVGVPRASLDLPIGIESREGPIITPLREWLKHPSVHGHDIAVAFDSDVTAILAMRVMATCLDAGMNTFHIAVSREGATAQIPLSFGKPDPPNAKMLTASVVTAGVLLKVAEGPLAPGCEHIGEGVTVSRLDGLIDRNMLAKCVARTHAAHHTNVASLLVMKETEFHEIVAVLDALRHDAETEAITLGLE